MGLSAFRFHIGILCMATCYGRVQNITPSLGEDLDTQPETSQALTDLNTGPETTPALKDNLNLALHPIVPGAIQEALSSENGEDMMVDGVPLSELPPHLVPAALLSERMQGATHPLQPVQMRELLDTTAYCTTEECVLLMQEYEQWLIDNGYGTVAGRWG